MDHFWSSYTCNQQITVYRALVCIKAYGLKRQFYLKQKNKKKNQISTCEEARKWSKDMEEHSS